MQSKKIIDQLNELRISISYDHVLQLESTIANSVCQQFQVDTIVCPSQLRKQLFTCGTLDNVDHNPSPATALSSFHGSAISLVQFPQKNNIGICHEPLTLDRGFTVKKLVLPQSFSVVPTVALNAATTSVPKNICRNFSGALDRHI